MAYIDGPTNPIEQRFVQIQANVFSAGFKAYVGGISVAAVSAIALCILGFDSTLIVPAVAIPLVIAEIGTILAGSAALCLTGWASYKLVETLVKNLRAAYEPKMA